MEELANPLIAGSRQAESLGFGAEAPVELGEGEAWIVDAVEDPEQTRRDARGERERASSVLEKDSRVCVRSQVTLCY